MSFFKSIIISIIAFSALAACQTLSPLEISMRTQSEIDRIDIGDANTRFEQIFLRALSDNLNQTTRLRDYDLTISLSQSNSSTLAVKGKSSNLAKTEMSLRYTLKDKMTSEVITQGSISATATSGTVSAYYAQDKSKQFAAERLTIQLADRLALRLRRHFLDS